MSQVLPVTAVEPASTGLTPLSPTGFERTLVRDVSAAVKHLNDAGFARPGQEITFSIDRATRLPVVKVIDTNTKEILSQWPAKYVLALAEENGRTEI